MKGFVHLLPAATKFGQGNVFTGVCDSVHGGGGFCLSACWDTTPPRADPPGSRPPQGADQPPYGSRPPFSGSRPPRPDPPGADTPPGVNPPGPAPPGEADSGIRSTSGRYASYWNAFLFQRGLQTRNSLNRT